MRWKWFVILPLLLSGCRYNDPSIDLLEGELRWMEDQLYMMESELDGACRQLAKCQAGKCECLDGNAHFTDSTMSTNNEVQQTNRPSSRITRPRIVMPFQEESGTSSTAESEADNTTGYQPPVIELPADPISRLPDSTLPATDVPAAPSFAAPDQTTPYQTMTAPTLGEPGGKAEDWEVVPSSPIMNDSYEVMGDGLPETLFENDSVVGEEIPVAQDPLSAETAQPNPDPSGSQPLPAELDDPGPVEPTPAMMEVIPPETAIPPTGTRPELEEGGAAARPAENEVSIKLLSHLEHVRGSRRSRVLPQRIDAHVTRIVCDAKRTARGIRVMVEPRNANNDFVALPGELSVVVLNTDESGPSARIARWNTSARDAASLVRNSSLEQGIVLNLNWPGAEPATDDLHVYIRYQTVDGRPVEADQRLGVASPSDSGALLKLSSELPEHDWEVSSPASDYSVSRPDAGGWTVVGDAPGIGSRSSVTRPATVISSFDAMEPAASPVKLPTRPLPNPLPDAEPPTSEQGPAEPRRLPTFSGSDLSTSSANSTTPTPTSTQSEPEKKQTDAEPPATKQVGTKSPTKPQLPRLQESNPAKTKPVIPKWSPER